ncbi:MAG: hypothetical protein RIB59_05545 [Rhodospirillales bacterium]
MPKNGKNHAVGQDAKTGRFVVADMKKKSGGEEWTLKPRGEGQATKVMTSAKSASSLDRITKKHGKALERLAKK